MTDPRRVPSTILSEAKSDFAFLLSDRTALDKIRRKFGYYCIRRNLYKAKPTHWVRFIKWKYQRLTRGWSDRDSWSFDNYLADVIVGGVKHLIKYQHSWDSFTYKTPEDEVVDMQKIVEAFEHYNAASDFNEACTCCAKPNESPRYCNYDKCPIIKEGMKLFIKMFPGLWD